MVTIVIIIIILAVIGAVLGGDGFFEAVSNGCGCVIVLALLLIGIIAVALS